MENARDEIGQLDGKKVILTTHAIERLSERLSELNRGQTPKKPVRTATKYFRLAKEENLPPRVRVKRLLNHRYIGAKYFIFEGWRFVLVDNGDRYSVVTIERDLFAA